jgi:hypothetical protein
MKIFNWLKNVNRGTVLLLLLVCVALFAPHLSTHGTVSVVFKWVLERIVIFYVLFLYGKDMIYHSIISAIKADTKKKRYQEIGWCAVGIIFSAMMIWIMSM